MRPTRILVQTAVAASMALLAPASRAQRPAADWPMYRHDLAGTGYSQLRQINSANVAKLAEAWSLNLTDRGDLEITPVVVHGVMYLPAAHRILALEAASGKEIWRYDVTHAPTRGVAYWPGDKNHLPRIIFTTFNRKLIALDAATGKPVPTFGIDGVVTLAVAYNGVPTIYKNTAFLGASVGELQTGPPGDSRAFDILTGRLCWTFHSVPQPGEPGHETWLNEGWKNRSGTNVWGWYMTVDEKTNTLFMPIGGPSTNYSGGDRPGANLFGNSIVAVDASSGKLKWYFQTIHHDLWDQDLPPGPGLVDLVEDGKVIPALVAVGKTGLMFILNRDTGKPVYGVEERPVARGDVPGEWYSPTQPFPLKPPPLARNRFKPEDLVSAEDTSPEHARACQALVAKSGGLYNAGPFTGWLYHEDGAPPKTTIQFPGGSGGSNWGGTATDPRSKYVFVQTHDIAFIGWMEKRETGLGYGPGDGGAGQSYDRSSVQGRGPYHDFSVNMKDATGRSLGSWPCQKPPWGRLIAVNANTGDIAWQVPLGITEGLPEGKQHTGNSVNAGPIATAGGLVFIGSTLDNRFRAFDSATGDELWVANLGKYANANPMTYQGKDGKQYVAIVATDTLFVFALP